MQWRKVYQLGTRHANIKDRQRLSTDENRRVSDKIVLRVARDVASTSYVLCCRIE
jgi:hypothetical protein